MVDKTKPNKISLVVELNDPVDRKEKYVQNRLLGMNKKDSARAAGYPEGSLYKAIYRLERDDEVQAELDHYRVELAKKFEFTREKSVEMAFEAYDTAKLMADSMGMIRAIQELNKMHGYYAPERKILNFNTTDNNQLLEQMERMSVQELASYIEGEVVN